MPCLAVERKSLPQVSPLSPTQAGEPVLTSLASDFGKKVKAPQQDDQLRSLLQRAKYLEPDEKARDGGIVSAALDPPIIFGSSSFQSD